MDAAFEQLSMRKDYIGSGYPFVVDGSLLEADSHAVASPYTFLTALTHFGPLASNEPETGASLFERVSAAALVQYLGGHATARSYHFGFPRREAPRSFRDALDDLCQSMGEGRGCKLRAPKVADMKDAKLDLAAWVSFGDGRRNQLSVFGQCAAGRNWFSKLNELQPVDFCNVWLREPPAMSPLVAFFVPAQVVDDDWFQACVGERRIFFDRLRIGRLLGDVDNDLAARCAGWTVSVID